MDRVVHAASAAFAAHFFGALPTASNPSRLTVAGLVFMIGSIGGVLALVAWCYVRLLSNAKPPATDGPFDSDD